MGQCRPTVDLAYDKLLTFYNGNIFEPTFLIFSLVLHAIDKIIDGNLLLIKTLRLKVEKTLSDDKKCTFLVKNAPNPTCSLSIAPGLPGAILLS